VKLDLAGETKANMIRWRPWPLEHQGHLYDGRLAFGTLSRSRPSIDEAAALGVSALKMPWLGWCRIAPGTEFEVPVRGFEAALE
jgi:hypothetical protein